MKIEQTQTPNSQEIHLLQKALTVSSFYAARKLFTRSETLILQKYVKTIPDGIIGPKTWEKIKQKAESLDLDELKKYKQQLAELRKRIEICETLSEIRKTITRDELLMIQGDIFQSRPGEIDGIRGKNTERGIKSRLKQLEKEAKKLKQDEKNAKKELAAEKAKELENLSQQTKNRTKPILVPEIKTSGPLTHKVVNISEEERKNLPFSEGWEPTTVISQLEPQPTIKQPSLENQPFFSNFSSEMSKNNGQFDIITLNSENIKLLEQKTLRKQYKSLADEVNLDFSEQRKQAVEKMIAEMEKCFGKKRELGGKGNTIDCSSLVSLGMKLFGVKEGTVAQIDSRYENKIMINEVMPGDFTIWRADDGNHIELVVEIPRFDPESKTWLVKTLGSAKATQAFDRAGKQLVTPSSLNLAEKGGIGYGVGYRIRKFSPNSADFYQELADGSHETSFVHFEDLQEYLPFIKDKKRLAYKTRA
ncbi:hypothetical protein AGMMS50249_6280 [candidate division SR1 bacterium]|nr:hypothetical protein AGMMS50249_6280 [candidate division SR1 bacterium]